MPGPIRVLHVLARLNCGGAEMRTLELARQLDRRQYQSDFCVLSGLPGELDDQARALGSEVHLLGLRRWDFGRRFRRLLRDGRYDVLHSHVHLASGYLLRLAAHEGTPVRLVHFHTTDDGQGNGWMRRAYRDLMRRWIDRHATDLVAVSRWVMASVWGPEWQSDRRCQVIYDGLEPSRLEVDGDRTAVGREFAVADAAPWYVHVGRITEAKNHRRLLSIFAAVRRRQPEARLLVVGQGDQELERRLRRQVVELNLEEAVTLAGGRSDAPRLLAAADAMIFPSRWEGLPGAVLEASAVGTPVVASALPSIREIAERLPGVRCLSLADGDDAWAAAAVDAAATGRSRAEAREAFRRSVFTVRECARALGRVWQGETSNRREAA